VSALLGTLLHAGGNTSPPADDITAVGFGAMASVLAWRWWGGRVDR